MISNPIAPIALGPIARIVQKPEAKSVEPTESFSQVLQNALSDVNNLQVESSKMDELLANGTLENVHQAMITAEKASLALQVTIQVRNKVVEAYQEVMRTQF